MDLDEATEFLNNSLADKQPLQNQEVQQLLSELAYLLPLAIAQAAAYLNRNRISVEKYLSLLRGTDQDMVRVMNREFRDETRYPGSNNAVATTWVVSFNEIRETDEAAANLLLFISYIEHKAIPKLLLPNPWSDEELEHAVGTLVAYAFLVRQEDEDIYDMHRLVHLAAKLWRNGQKELKPGIEEVIRHLKSVFRIPDPENHQPWRQYLHHAVRVIENSSQCSIDERYELLFSVGKCLYQDRHLQAAVMAFEHISEAINMLKKVHAVRVQILPPHDSLRLATEQALATAYLQVGQTETGIAMLERVAAVQKTQPEEFGHLVNKHDLGQAYLMDDRVEEAIEMLEQVVVSKKEVMREEDPSRLLSERELARAYRQARRVQDAIDILEPAVAIYRKLPGHNKERLAAEYELERAYFERGRVQESIDVPESVVAGKRRITPEGYPGRLVSEEQPESAILQS
ncbi:hypothetical protein GGR52DRAFT_586203 [Hypoxylon sp. FL1284]|nr:hypothetical protein GGR52DRAFT_586203 [Hypoxylon sp. FL1284]